MWADRIVIRSSSQCLKSEPCGGGGNVGPRRLGYTPAQAERYRRAVSNNRRPAVVTEREALDAFMTICQFFRE